MEEGTYLFDAEIDGPEGEFELMDGEEGGVEIYGGEGVDEADEGDEVLHALL